MFMILLTYVKPLDEVDRLLDDHNAYLERNYERGRFVASGRRVPRTRGVIPGPRGEHRGDRGDGARGPVRAHGHRRVRGDRVRAEPVGAGPRGAAVTRPVLDLGRARIRPDELGG
jgi:hypothetical protein